MTDYKDQLAWVKTLSIKEGGRVTTDCIFCGGTNKFTADRFDGKIIWNCYRASCNVKGIYSGQRNVTAVKAKLSGNSIQRHKPEAKPIPSITTNISNSDNAITYLKKVNSYEAYIRGDIKIRYAPTEGRVLFYNKDQTGAVGRSLRSVRAKWWSYGELSEGIHVGNGSHAVLVEDVASACAVSNLDGFTGIAILGTNITKPIKRSLNYYKKVTLVLDNDASSKSIMLSRSINCNVRLTKHDLKYLSSDKIRTILK